MLATLNLDVPFDTLVGASMLVLNRVVADLPGGLSHNLTDGASVALVSGFTTLVCLAAAFTWGALLLTFKALLAAKKGAPSFLNYTVAGLFMAAIPLFFNGFRVMLIGTLAIVLLKLLAAYEIGLYTKDQKADYLEAELGHLNVDADSWETKEGGCLALLNLGGFFPLAGWGRLVRPFFLNAARGLALSARSFQLFYQGLWYNKKYRRTRKKIRRFFESPIRLRRYWYLTCRWEMRAELAWLGVPFRQYPQFKCGNTFLGLSLRKLTGLVGYIISVLRLEPLVPVFQRLAANLIRTTRRLWNDRPSAIQGFIDLFQPEAPVYVRGGHTITPPARRPRLVNLVSDMEVFASRGSSLLVFMFLVWSFFARVLLVMCLLGVF